MYKIDKLLKAEGKLFHTQDLAVIWEINNKNTLYTTIKRYVQKGILIPVFKGLYSTVPISSLDPYLLGSYVLHSFCYVTTETVLYNEGLISQKIQVITFASSVSKKFTIGDHGFLSRKIKNEILFDQKGIYEKDGVFWATSERAVSDMLYFNPNYHLDKKEDY